MTTFVDYFPLCQVMTSTAGIRQSLIAALLSEGGLAERFIEELRQPPILHSAAVANEMVVHDVKPLENQGAQEAW